MRWLTTSSLANQSSPTLTTPKCTNIKNYHQIIMLPFVHEQTFPKIGLLIEFPLSQPWRLHRDYLKLQT